MWKLDEIRQRTAYEEQKRTQKDAVRDYLRSRQADFGFALTLTFKPSTLVVNDKGTYYRKLNKDVVADAAAKFKRRLNNIALGSAAKRHGKSLNYFFVMEGERSSKQLHLHIALGGELKRIGMNGLVKAIEQAAALCEGTGEKIDVQIADSDWLSYMTKEVGKHDTDNVLWELA